MKSNLSQLTAGLYIVATPIGNLGDMTFRAVETLKQADLIACEDTRVTAKLLSHFGIDAPTISYNDHNAKERRPIILKALREGKVVALVSDAGTPLVSDPGYKLVRDVVAEDIYVTALPGASSVMAALCIAGLPTDQFFFAGFIPAKQEAARQYLQPLKHMQTTLVFFESARRLIDSLKILHEVLGDRPAAVTRELTKLYEEARRGSLSDLLAHYSKEGEPKGEVVLVIGGALQQSASDEDIATKLAVLLQSHSVKEAASILAEESGRPRKDVYSMALKIMQGRGDG